VTTLAKKSQAHQQRSISEFNNSTQLAYMNAEIVESEDPLNCYESSMQRESIQ